MVLGAIGLDKLAAPALLPRLVGLADAQGIAHEVEERGGIALPHSGMLGIEARLGIGCAQQAMLLADVAVYPMQIGCGS